MRERHFRPVAPQRLFPPRTRPSRPVGTPFDTPSRGPARYDRPTSPMNRGYPLPPGVPRPKWTRYPKGLRGLRFLGPVGQLLQVIVDADEWMRPGAPVGQPGGWTVPAGWSQCPTPHCDKPVEQWWWVSGNTCTDMNPAECFAITSSLASVAPGTPHATRVKLIMQAADDPIFGPDSCPTVGQFIRDSPTNTNYPSFKVGFVFLPDEFAAPPSLPQYAPEKYYGDSRVGAVGTAGLVTRPHSRPGAPTVPGPYPDPDVEGPVVPPGPGVPAVSVGGGGNVPPRPTEHFQVPPPRGSKEKKLRWNYGAAGRVYGGLTEFADMMDCMWEAAGGAGKLTGTMQSKMVKLWRKLNDPEEDYSPDQFAYCMAVSSAKDFAIGRLTSGAAKAQNRSPYSSKRPGGYRGGGWGTRMH